MWSTGPSTESSDPGASGRIHSTESFGTLDGPGVRFVVFFAGCPLRCRYCHNPDTWDPERGARRRVEELMAQILRCRGYLSGGVTLSGGEPLAQPAFAQALLRACRREGLHTALDTAGSLPLAQTRTVLDAADLVLLDLKAADDALARQLTGHGNAETLATLDYLEQTGKPVWLRQVLVPGWTLVPEQLIATAELLRPYRCLERVELLPFHQLGAFKYRELGIAYPLADCPEPTACELAAAKAIFQERGLPV